jgi:RNA polymerase sigma factor (sigma-70 family)
VRGDRCCAEAYSASAASRWMRPGVRLRRSQALLPEGRTSAIRGGGVGVDRVVRQASPATAGTGRVASPAHEGTGRHPSRSSGTRPVTRPSSPVGIGPPRFDEVYREHAARVYRFCLSQVRDPAEAEDIAAEVFVSALSAYERTRPDAGDMQPWLLRIARNEIIDRERRRQRRSLVLARFFSGGSEMDPTVNVEAQVLLRDELKRVLDVMKQLSARDRLLIGLRLAADLPYAEIGAVVGISEHAATVATRRAVKRLRICLGGEG